MEGCLRTDVRVDSNDLPSCNRSFNSSDVISAQLFPAGSNVFAHSLHDCDSVQSRFFFLTGFASTVESESDVFVTSNVVPMFESFRSGMTQI